MRVEDLTTFEGECPTIVVFSAYMDIRIPLTKKWKKIINEKEDCAKIIDDEVKSIGMWMWGDVKGYVLEKKVAFTKKYKDESREDEDCEEWEEVDSCWGCYEETDELIKEVMIENGLEE